MREGDISTKRFRELAKEVGSLLTYEATSDFETEKVTIDGWNGPVEVDQIKGKKVTVVPILRAGLGMMDGVLEHMPSARVSVVGIYRDEETLQPVPYFEKIVSNIEERLALVIDPMLATGGSHDRHHRPAQEEGLPVHQGAGAGCRAGRHQGAGSRSPGRGAVLCLHRPGPEREGLHCPGSGRRRRQDLRHQVSLDHLIARQQARKRSRHPAGSAVFPPRLAAMRALPLP